MEASIEVVRHDTGNPAMVEAVLRELPEWFGIEDAILDYAAHAGRYPTYTATDGRDGAYGSDGSEGAPVLGLLVLTSHGPGSAEVHLLAVRPAAHRRGIGRALMAAAEQDLRDESVGFLQVKTLGPSRPDPHYDATRDFYLALGYTPLEEHPADSLWDGNPCLVLVRHLACA